jgi:hypothetical protein
MATWANTTLCTLADIESEVADLQIPLQVGGTTGEKEVKVAAKITLAKRQLKTKLLVALQRHRLRLQLDRARYDAGQDQQPHGSA